MYSKYLNLTRAVPPKFPNRRRGENFVMKKDKIFYCDVCKRVWEKVLTTGHVKPYFEYYEILPKLGKPIKTCPECVG